MQESKKRCLTTFKNNVLDNDISNYLFQDLKTSINWQAGIKSKKGFTRKAYVVSCNDKLFQELIPYVQECLNKLTKQSYAILGLYLNFYENGEMYTPNHCHKGTHQLVISLGNTRTLIVGKKEYIMNNGDAILFGSTIHGVPKEKTNLGRISIATFMIPID